MPSTPLGGIPGFTATGPLSGPTNSGLSSAPSSTPSSSPGADTGDSPYDQFTVPEPSPSRGEPGRVPSPQQVRGPARAAIGRDSAGNEWSTESIGGQPHMPHQQQRRSSGALRFQTPGGRTVSAREATSDTLVVRDGVVESDLGSLLASGLVEEGPDGYRWAADDGGSAGESDVAPGDQDTGEGEHQAGQQEPVRFDDPQLEQFVSQLQGQHGALYDKMVELVASRGQGGTLPAHPIEQAAAELGVTTEEARETINTVAEAFRFQFARYVSDSGIDPQNMAEWLTSENLDKEVKELFQRAMKAHARDRTLNAYDHVVARFLETLARDYPEALMKQLEGHANLRKDPTTGAILVDIPGMGETTFETAARQGWLKTRRDARGRFTSS